MCSGDVVHPRCCREAPFGRAYCPPPPPSWSYEPCWPDGPVVAEGPIGPFGALPPFFHEFLEPLEHSVLDAALDGRLMEGIPVLLDPLDHLVLEMALNDGPLEEMSNLEP